MPRDRNRDHPRATTMISFYRAQAPAHVAALTWKVGDRVVTADGKRTGPIGGLARVDMRAIQVTVVDTQSRFAFKIDSRQLEKLDMANARIVALWLGAEEVVAPAGRRLIEGDDSDALIADWLRMTRGRRA